MTEKKLIYVEDGDVKIQVTEAIGAAIKRMTGGVVVDSITLEIVSRNESPVSPVNPPANPTLDAPLPAVRFSSLLQVLVPRKTYKQIVVPQLVDMYDAYGEVSKDRPGLARWVVIREGIAIVWRLLWAPVVSIIELFKA